MKLAIFVLYSMLNGLGPHNLDTETEAERRARMSVLAQAMVESAERVTCSGAWDVETCKAVHSWSFEEALAAQYTIGVFESYFAQHIHEDRCRTEIGECDGGKAKSVWQLQAYRPLTDETWATIGGADLPSTRRASLAAAVVLSRARRCGTTIGMFRSYGTSRCDGKLPEGHGRERVAAYQRALAKIRAGLAKE